MAIKELQAYELLREEGLSDIQSVGYLLRHRKSGARIMVIANDDDNKVYCMWECSEAAAERIRLSDGAGQALCDDRAK